MRADHQKQILPVVGISAILFGSFVLKRPLSPKWPANGPSLLEGMVFSKETWRTISDWGIKGVVFGGFGYYFIRLVKDREKAKNQAIGGFSAFLLTEGVTSITKRLVARERPNRMDNMSFFSGHASYAFSIAVYLSMNLFDNYGEDHPVVTKAVAALLIGSAAVTSVARSGAGRHYFLDVVVGMIVGTGIGFLNHRVFNTDQPSSCRREICSLIPSRNSSQ